MNKLRLYYPVCPFYVSQGFGQNLPCVKDFGLPTQNIVTGADNATCPIGYEKLYEKFGWTGHDGMDLQAGIQPVRAACGGKVVEIQDVPARGLGVGILTNEQYDFAELGPHYAKVRYWHLQEIHVKAGDTIEVGQVIGISDSTGYSSGNHLHFELDLMDLDTGGHPYFAYGNGVFFGNQIIAGSCDPAPYFTGTYAEDYAPMVSLYQTLVAALSALVAELKKPH